MNSFVRKLSIVIITTDTGRTSLYFTFMNLAVSHVHTVVESISTSNYVFHTRSRRRVPVLPH